MTIREILGKNFKPLTGHKLRGKRGKITEEEIKKLIETTRKSNPVR